MSYTPAEVVRLLVQLTKPEAGNTIYDPTAGSGGFLIQSHQYVEEQGQDPNDLALYGQDSNGTVWSICTMNMILHNITRFTIETGDTLGEPQIQENGQIRKFDRVLANPPGRAVNLLMLERTAGYLDAHFDCVGEGAEATSADDLHGLG